MAKQIVITEEELNRVIAHKLEMSELFTNPELKAYYHAEYVAYLNLEWEFFIKPSLKD